MLSILTVFLLDFAPPLSAWNHAQRDIVVRLSLRFCDVISGKWHNRQKQRSRAMPRLRAVALLLGVHLA